MPLSIGIIGLASFYGSAYAHRASGRADCEVVAASTVGVDEETLEILGRPTSDAFATEYDCPVYESVDPVFEAADAVVVATATTRRAADARRVLDRDLPALVAKPSAGSYAEARRLASAAETSSAPIVFTTPARYDDAIRGVVERTEAGAIGDVVAVRANIRHDRVPEAGLPANAENAPDQAGPAYAMAVYTADVLLWLADDVPERVTAEYVNVNTPYSTHPDLGTGTVRFGDGALGTMTMTYSTDCRESWGNWEIEVVGTDGILRTAHQGYEGIHWTAGTPDERSTAVFGRTTSPVLDRTLDAFCTAIHDERSGQTPTADEIAAAIGLCNAWERAGDEGSVALDDWPPTMSTFE